MSEMQEKVKALQTPLTTEEIDFRVQSITKKGNAIIIPYKDSRTDMKRLDDCVGALNWRKRYVRDNKNCVVSIKDEKGEWIDKEDVGTAGSGNEQEKTVASDSFKRACFNWGIGRELYDYPLILIKLNDNEWNKDECSKDQKAKPKQTWNLKVKEWSWISHFEGGILKGLAAKDTSGKVRFNWGSFPKKEPAK